MKEILLIILLSTLWLGDIWAQQYKGDIREGNRNFKSEKFDDSEVSYRKALENQNNSLQATFNLGDALYRQKKFEEAGKEFSSASLKNTSKEVQAQAYHNLGNSLLQAGKLDECIDAYKNALRRNPQDMETKYNLAYAQNLKKKQEEQKKQNKDQNKDQKKDKNKDQQKQDQQKQDQQKQDQQKQQQQTGKISKEDAKRLLAALNNDEKATQKKVKKAKALANRVRTLKDW
ncbi:MAG: tetratricopeptide repeat protein [Bacteroidales bacterium]|nr:tetratricopeptide repeat protein [Bacteroidales bacterium]